MWRFVTLAALGLFIGTTTRSERGVVLLSLFVGLLFGGAAVINASIVSEAPSTGRVLLSLVLGLVLAAPVYAVAEIWRRTRTRVVAWLRRLMRS